jgi:VWFA-related protein
MKKRSVAAVSILLFSFLAPTAPAQEPSSPFGETIDVRVVNVEVVVTDRDGNRVTGLGPRDLRLKVDGKEVPIEYFTEVREGQAVTAEGESGAQSGAPAGGVEPGEPVATNYLIFVDDLFAVGEHRDEVLRRLKSDLARLGPADRMAVVAYDGGRLAVLSGWTSSASHLQQAFDRAMSRPSRGVGQQAELRSTLGQVRFEKEIEQIINQQGGKGSEILLDEDLDQPEDPASSKPGKADLSQHEYVYGQVLLRRLEGAVSAAVSAMRGFGNPPGRKVMMLMAGGWPFSIQSYIRGQGKTPLSREFPEGEEILRPLTSTANLLGYTVYPVDMQGVASNAADVEARGPLQTANAISGGKLREQEIEGSLQFIAGETGGKPLLNSNRSVALAEVSRDTRSYYWLGFTPTWKRNDQSHRVEVEAVRPGLEARSRGNFLDLSRRAEISMKVESALLLGGLPGAVPLPVRLGTPKRTKKGQLEIPLTLGLPADLLTMIPQDGQYTTQVELRVAATDDEGNGSEIPVIPLTLSAPRPPRPGGFVRYDTKLKLQGTAKRLVVAVYDPLSGKIATAQVEIPGES